MPIGMGRRSFVEMLLGSAPLLRVGQTVWAQVVGRHVSKGADRYKAVRQINATNPLAFKVADQDTMGGLFVIEHTSLSKDGPPRHLHHDQEEWFYVLEGTYVAEVGSERFTLNAGDSLLAPRKVPHVWAFTGNATGRILIGFAPAGKMQHFFEQLTTQAGTRQDAELLREHGMEFVGPPLTV